MKWTGRTEAGNGCQQAHLDIFRRRDNRIDRGALSQIDRNYDRLDMVRLRQFGREGFKRVAATRDHHQIEARLGKANCDRPSDAVRRSGHNGPRSILRAPISRSSRTTRMDWRGNRRSLNPTSPIASCTKPIRHDSALW